MNRKIIAAAMSAWLMSSTAFAHTNSIGYVGDGSGGLNFWYGSWHSGTTFNEAEIKIEGTDSNGNTITFSDGNGGTQNYSIDAFTLLTPSSPAGLISGVNFFTSDGTQLVAYDPTGATNGGTTQESYTWQGINYQNLVTGNYTFTYIPLGSTESSYPNQSPTADWMPMDNVILSLSITLTTGDLTGDANQNGILDVEEVAAGASGGSGPTVVSQGSSTAIAYVTGTVGNIQTVNRTQTDTTWDNMSDGTTQNTQSTSTELTPFEGRVDQIATVKDVTSSTLRNLNFYNIQTIKMNSKMKNGMGGNTNGIVIGGSKELNNGVNIMGGVTRLNTHLSGNDDTVDSETTSFSVGIENKGVSLELRRENTDYTVSRTIGDFANGGETSSNDTNVKVMYSPNTGKVQPIIGYTRGKHTVNEYRETGSSQTARIVDATNETYGYGTVGLTGDLGLVDFSLKHHTDNVNDISLGLEKDTGTVTWRIEGIRSISDLGNTNAISAGLMINF